MNTLWLPTIKKEIVRPWFLPSKESLEAQEAMLRNFYFLVRQGDVFGERLRCTRCGGRHNYITLMCVERPFSGITGGLYAYYRAVGDNRLENALSPEEKERFRAIGDALRVPDISTAHPQMAKSITKGLGPSDLQWGALSLGILEGIATIHAFKLVQKINDRGLKPRLVLETPNGATVYR